MQLLLEHSQNGKVFRLWAKYELLPQERELVERYNINKVVLVEGNPSQERDRAMKMAIALAVVVFLLAFAGFWAAFFRNPFDNYRLRSRVDCILLSYPRNYKR